MFLQLINPEQRSHLHKLCPYNYRSLARTEISNDKDSAVD